ncbi:MAG TPA: cytochrome P450 [Pyrinomonadaceae bacterium]
MRQSPTTHTSVYPPGPKGAFFGANLQLAIRRDPLGFMERLAREYGDVVHFRLGRRRVYLLNHPEHVKGVLLTHYDNFLKGRGHARRDNFLGLGLVTSEGAFHRRQRQLTQPAFNHERINAYAETMAGLTAEAAAAWREGERLDVLDAMRQITLPIASQTLFGTRVDTEHERIIEAFRTGLNRFRWFKPSGSALGHRLSPVRRLRDRQSRETIETLVSQIIDWRRREDEDRGDLLSLLLSRPADEGEQLTSDRQIRDEAVTLFIAGFENIATALTWTFYLLAQHPEVEARLHEELDAVLGGRPPGAGDIPRLAYTRMVLEEAMRVYPPVPRLVRTAVRDYEVGGYTVPAGSLVVVSQYAMHRDPRFWEDPERFDPERFAPEAKRSRPPYTYFPFGGGSRRCIGDGFAYMEGVLVLATLASRWRLRLDPRDRVGMLATHFLHPKGPMWMTAEGREADAAAGQAFRRSA